MSQHVVIIGGGVIGLCSAYYLNRSGFKVTVIDQTSGQDSCSYGNAGMIVPSHVMPLAAPGMIAKGVRWMFNPESPFYVRPRLNADLMRWGWLFYRNSSAKHVERAVPALKNISVLSKDLFRSMSQNGLQFQFEEQGLMMLFQSEKVGQEEVETAELARVAGLQAEVLTASQVQAMEPEVKLDIAGGVYYPGDAHLVPGEFMATLKRQLAVNGVQFLWDTTLLNFQFDRGQLRGVLTSAGEIVADEVVIATGSWSGEVARKLNMKLPMQAGKGYSFTVPKVKTQLKVPSILCEAKVAVTPMVNDLRFAGTMEIAGIDHSVNPKRVKGIVDAASRYFPEFEFESPANEQVWAGLRPVSPDGLPYIGRTARWKNVTIATGHAMMGLSLGPATGKLIADVLTNESPEVDMACFNPDRFA